MHHIGRILITVLAISSFDGCYNYSTQNFDVEGMMPLPQVHINSLKEDSQKIILSGSIASSFEKQWTGNISPGHTKVNDNGVFEGDIIYTDRNRIEMREHPGANVNTFAGNNFRWQLPKYSIDLGIDLPMEKQSYLTVRMNLSMFDKYENWGFGAGYARESIYKDYGFRSEAGLSFQELSINATYWSTFLESYDDYRFELENEKVFRFGMHTALTLFTAYSEQNLNGFIQGGIQWQRLSYFSGIPNIWGGLAFPGGTFYFSITPGVFVDITKNTKLIAGIRFMKDFEIDNSNVLFFVLPFVQIDLSLY